MHRVRINIYALSVLLFLSGLVVEKSSLAALDDPHQFVQQQYRDFLSREGDAGGIQFWAGLLENGSISRADVISNFFASPEFQSKVTPIVRLYLASFSRIPDFEGLEFWKKQFISGRTLNEISGMFAISNEFNNLYGDLNDVGFVIRLYENVLLRSPGSEELDFWVNKLQAGVTRGAVVVSFSESPEFVKQSFSAVQTIMVYAGMLQRQPDPQGFSFWAFGLSQGTFVLIDLINGFLDSEEYVNRFIAVNASIISKTQLNGMWWQLVSSSCTLGFCAESAFLYTFGFTNCVQNSCAGRRQSWINNGNGWKARQALPFSFAWTLNENTLQLSFGGISGRVETFTINRFINNQGILELSSNDFNSSRFLKCGFSGFPILISSALGCQRV